MLSFKGLRAEIRCPVNIPVGFHLTSNRLRTCSGCTLTFPEYENDGCQILTSFGFDNVIIAEPGTATGEEFLLLSIRVAIFHNGRKESPVVRIWKIGSEK
jgi:hypothetical protein